MNFLKNNKKGLIVGAAAIIVAVTIYHFWLKGSEVAAFVVERRDYIPSLIISGEVIPETSVALSSQTAGVVLQCLVKKGELVQQGQILVQLDDRLARVDFERAEKSVQMAQLNLHQAATVTMEEVRLNSVEADLELEQLQREYNRTLALREAGAVSEQELELAEMKLKLATEAARSAKIAWEAFQDDGVNISILKTELQQRQQDLADKQVILQQYQIAAPYPGEILDLYVGAGELLQAGSKVAMISSSQYSRVRIRPDQRYAAMAAIGNKAQIWIPSQAHTKWESQVVFAEPVGNADQGTITAELSLPNNSADLYPGQLVSVQLYGQMASQSIIIPEAYLNVQQGKSGVWLAINGRAHFAEVEVGLQTPEGALIQSGLQEGDILLATTGLKEGQQVVTRTERSQ